VFATRDGLSVVNILIDGGVLRRQMARRGLSARDLARQSSLSPPTILAAMAGGPISMSSFRIISETLAQIPILDIAEALLHDVDERANADGDESNL